MFAKWMIGVAALSFLSYGSATVPAKKAGSFTVDGVHSSAVFKVKHANISYFYGRFNEMSGTFLLDSKAADGNSISFEIKTDSVDTANAARDKHLKGPDFFNVKQFPTASFKSTKVEADGENKFKVTGDLNVCGTTKSITIELTKTGEGETMFKDYRAGFETEFSINRSEFGIKYGAGALSEDVKIMVSAEGVRK